MPSTFVRRINIRCGAHAARAVWWNSWATWRRRKRKGAHRKHRRQNWRRKRGEVVFSHLTEMWKLCSSMELWRQISVSVVWLHFATRLHSGLRVVWQRRRREKKRVRQSVEREASIIPVASVDFRRSDGADALSRLFCRELKAHHSSVCWIAVLLINRAFFSSVLIRITHKTRCTAYFNLFFMRLVFSASFQNDTPKIKVYLHNYTGSSYNLGV